MPRAGFVCGRPEAFRRIISFSRHLVVMSAQFEMVIPRQKQHSCRLSVNLACTRL